MVALLRAVWGVGLRGRRASAAVPGRPWASSCFTLSSSSLWMEQHAQPFCSCTVSAPAMVPAVLISCGRARGQGPPRGLAYPVIWAQSNRRVRCLWIPAYVCARLFPVWVENATVLNASEKFCVRCIIFAWRGGLSRLSMAGMLHITVPLCCTDRKKQNRDRKEEGSGSAGDAPPRRCSPRPRRSR